MRTARIRTGWKNKRREISIEEHAAAVAAVAWRVALNAAKNLHEQAFIYETDQQRLGVMREYLYFFIHAADRCARGKFEPARRVRFITGLSHQCRRHYLENERDVTATGSDGDRFIEQLNQRMDGYAGARFIQDQPGYEAFRALGLRVQECMGYSQTNKWVQDQVMEIDGPEAFRIFNKALLALNKSAGTSTPADEAGDKT